MEHLINETTYSIILVSYWHSTVSISYSRSIIFALSFIGVRNAQQIKENLGAVGTYNIYNL